MNLETFFGKFDVFADCPNAVQKMRELILELAVQGKLVEQDEGEGNARELIGEIKAQKMALGIRVEVSERAPASQFLFALPSSWEWVGATSVAAMISDQGRKVQTKEILESGTYPVVDQGKVFIRGYCNYPERVISVVDPIVLFGDHTRETKLIDFDFVVGADGVKLLQPMCVFPAYYFLAIRWLPIESRGYGRHFKLLKKSLIPLPPLAEQKRIVAKVDELMALCDALEAQQKEREAKRTALAKASLAAFAEAPSPASLEHLFHPSYAIDPADLRKSILTLAVQGKLVPHDGEVLQAQLGDLLAEASLNGVSKGPIDDPSETEVLRISAGTSRQDFVVDESDFKYVKLLPDEVEKFQIQPYDLLACRFNGNLRYVGRFSIYLGQSSRVQVNPDKLIRFRIDTSKYDPMYVCYSMNSEVTRTIIESMCATTAGNIGISAGRLKTVPIPLPPLAEQKRIVAKVDELMALVDRLEAQEKETQEKGARLLEAMVADLSGKTAA